MRDSKDIEDRATMVGRIFCEYGKSKREFITIAELCSVKGWPDRKVAIQKAFKLQILFDQRETMRFDHLLSRQAPEIAAYKSLSEISDRLTKQWNEGDEASIVGDSCTYRDVLHEIEICQASLDSDALDGPFKAAQRDSEYLRARQILQEKLHSLNSQLSA